MTDPFDILFEPVPIGPVTAPNRFYQVPHCNGMGYRHPQSIAAVRGIKAEGGWGVVCTEETEIHHSSDLSPYTEGRLWDERDLPALQKTTEAVHAHGALAGIELAYNGHHASNLYSRVPALSVRALGDAYNPWQARRMDKDDIRNVRRWHRQAALLARQAGFDIIYCYAGHDLSLAMHFLLPRYNNRTDEYGGSLTNRVRFLRELIEDTKDAVGDTCAVAVRLAVDELLGPEGLTHDGEGREIVSLLAELPDLWDVNVSSWENDSVTSRFAKEGYQEAYISFVKTLTSKPVVGVGRYTSPESMVSAIRRGVMDFIGAARPSIADPFLPQKIREGRVEDIRECIGCNICVTGDFLSVPIRCTQNPTMGEEWRRGWHPERINPAKSKEPILIIGGGPAGLECARALGQRGYPVTLTEARRNLGGRVALESLLPGLSEWRRVIDWRLTQIDKLPNVALYPSSPMQAEDILNVGFSRVIVATGAHWRADGVSRSRWQSLPGRDLLPIFTPDDLMAGRLPQGRVLIFDDDHYYFGGVLAELLVEQGCQVSLATPAPLVSYWTKNNLEQRRIQKRLVQLGVPVYLNHTLDEINPQGTQIRDTITGVDETFPCDAVVLVTERITNDTLYDALKPALAEGLLTHLGLIGDAQAPHLIVQAVFSGHLAARELDEPPVDGITPFRREISALCNDQ
ncbi:MAG TPA: NADH:flavin oxidoreductase [Chloroflexi bacterium]|nr:NADH:flavin oxidoreductase [Chloroflexota bacterium]